MSAIFPYLRRDDSPISVLGLTGTHTIYFTAPFPVLWRHPLQWLVSRRRWLDCMRRKAGGTIVCQLEDESVARARGWTPDQGMPN